jgi:predicted enzyme related to lactoylglutathione lyase
MLTAVSSLVNFAIARHSESNTLPSMDGNRLNQKESVMRIGLVSLFVDDQEKARTFYTDVVGLQVKSDAPYGPEERWLTVVSPEEPDGVEAVLHLSDDAARVYQQAAKAVGRPSLSLDSDDAQRDYERLLANGVEFVMPPTRMDYGGTDAVFDDTCGNLINLHQE